MQRYPVILACCLGILGSACSGTAQGRDQACLEATAHVEECLGEGYPLGDLSCDSDEDYSVAREINDLTCEELQTLGPPGKGIDLCTELLYKLGICNPKLPAFECGSDFGTEVAEAVWYSNHAQGTVPTFQVIASSTARELPDNEARTGKTINK